jgi:hypothetical protein
MTRVLITSVAYGGLNVGDDAILAARNGPLGTCLSERLVSVVLKTLLVLPIPPVQPLPAALQTNASIFS